MKVLRLKNRYFRMSANSVLLAIIFLIGSLQVLAVNAQDAASQPATQINKSSVASFLDQLVPELLQDWHVPGATIAVVKDGQVLAARGYGLASLDDQVPVDPDRTLFRIGSVTKLFTWTAIMQLVEQDKLDLHTDINQYLSGFQIPANAWNPITLTDLMSHTAGFEDRGLIGTLARVPNEVIPLEQYLIDHMPKRVRRPGRISAYSNYGGALAGYIVSQSSGMPYEQYVEEKIFVPLGITAATARQAANESMATGHDFRKGNWQTLPFACVIPVPEGGISASATSMARFMIVHLEGGQFQDNSIMGETTLGHMHRQSFFHHPELPGYAHGFEENTIRGRRALEHGGYLQGFSSFLVLVPSERLGLFVSFNSAGGSAASHELRRQFFDAFLSEPQSADATADSSIALDPTQFTGSFAPCRRAATTIAKLGVLMQSVSLSSDGDSISFLGREWDPVGQDLFRSREARENNQLLATRADLHDKTEYLFIGTAAWQRLPWYQSPGFQLSVLAGCLLLFLSAIVTWPAGYVIARRRKGVQAQAAESTIFSSMARWIAILCAFLNVVFVIAIAVILSGDTSALEFGVPPGLRLLLTVPFVSVALTAGMLASSIASWKQNWWNDLGRIHYSCVTLASLTFVWFLSFWNLIGWNF